MVLGRILAGLGIGISSAVAPLYISEVSRNINYSSHTILCMHN